MRIILLAFVLLLSSCRALDGYRRTYSAHLEDERGRRAGLGVMIEPMDVRRSGK